jgi:hypothetical protein
LRELALELGSQATGLIDRRNREYYLLLEVRSILFKLLDGAQWLCDGAAQKI